jgi:hypothetical protein
LRRGQQGGSAAIAGATFGLAGRLRLSVGDPRALFRDALEREIAERRPFLWLSAAAGAGVVLYLSADPEAGPLGAGSGIRRVAALAWLTRDKRGAFALFAALAAVSPGFVSADWKSARVAAPVLDRVRVTTAGFIEQMDHRRQGARFVMRLASAEGLSPEQMPRRIRLTDRYRSPAEAGAFVGAERGPDYDIAIAPTGESAAVRTADGQLTVLGTRPSGCVSEQWLRADADPRAPKAGHNAAQCDGSGCSAELPDGRIVALLQKRDALLEDCTRGARHGAVPSTGRLRRGDDHRPPPPR